jgi:hypothetical protein
MSYETNIICMHKMDLDEYYVTMYDDIELDECRRIEKKQICAHKDICNFLPYMIPIIFISIIIYVLLEAFSSYFMQ